MPSTLGLIYSASRDCLEDLKKALFYFGTSELKDKCGDTVPQTLNELQALENKIPKFVKNGHSKKKHVPKFDVLR